MKLKIITVHLNNLEGFISTFHSIYNFMKKNDDVEWIIKDGYSEQLVVNNIAEKIKTLPRTQFISTKDMGVYDAMNQTFGYFDDDDMVLFLNAGDRLSSDFIRNYLKGILTNFDLFFSDMLLGQNEKLILAPAQIDFAYLISKTINHQSLILKGSLLKKYNFKSDYSIVADWVQLFEIFKFEKLNIKKLDYPISIYEGGGISERQDFMRKQQRQNYLKKMYSDWELESILIISRLRQRNWYNFILKTLDSPKRSKILSMISKILA